MKYFFTGLLLLTVSFVSAQIVNIPDAAFKQALFNHTPVIDTNDDGEIQMSEAEAVINMEIYNQNITNLTGILAFTNMRSLSCGYNQITSLDVSGLTNLESLSCNANPLTSLHIQGSINLKELNCEGNQLTSLNLSGLINLHDVNVRANRLASIDLTGLNSLNTLQLEGNPLVTLNVNNLPNLGVLWCNYTQTISTLNVSNCPRLFRIECHNGSLTTVNLGPGLDTLIDFDFYSNHLTQLDISHCKARLVSIDVMNNQLTSIDLSHMDSLQMASLGYNNLTSIDVSNCPNLLGLTANYNPLVNANVKNGPGSAIGFSFNNCPNLVNICADAADIPHYLQYDIPNSNLTGVNINSYCSYTPGGTYNTIQGSVKADINNNGCGPTDPGVPALFVKVNDGTSNSYTATTMNGDYSYFSGAGNFSVEPYFPYPYFTFSPLSSSVNFATNNNLSNTVNFCATPTGIHNDLEITFLPIIAANPGMGAEYKLIYRNRGTSSQSGTVVLNYDQGKMNFDHASVSANTQNTGQLVWNYNNLQPFETRNIDVHFILFMPPVNNAGDTLIYLTSITPASGDETPSNNSFILPQAVVSSHDPNDKLCLEGNKIAVTSIDKPLHYLIRFQNTGTANAYNVVIADTLDNHVDWNSFQFTSSSHPCHLNRKDGKLEFYFENINLPYQSVDDPGSNGFVAYEVKPKNTLIINDSINNKAAIYFDFNAPVITNTVTTIVSPTASVAVKLEYFSLSAKNETNLLTWKAPATSGSALFGIERSNDGIHFSNFGNITATADRCQLPFNFTDEKPFDGKTWYRLNIKDADGHSFYSKVLVAGRTKSGVSINAIVSDRNNTTIYLNASKEQNLQMKIIAADGRLLYNQNKTIEAGSSTLNLPLKNIASGIYTLIVYTNDGEVITKRFVK